MSRVCFTFFFQHQQTQQQTQCLMFFSPACLTHRAQRLLEPLHGTRGAGGRAPRTHSGARRLQPHARGLCRPRSLCRLRRPRRRPQSAAAATHPLHTHVLFHTRPWWTVFRLVWERDREGVNAELEAERAQHSAEISMRASQHIVQANALEHRAREEDKAVCVRRLPPFLFLVSLTFLRASGFETGTAGTARALHDGGRHQRAGGGPAACSKD